MMRTGLLAICVLVAAFTLSKAQVQEGPINIAAYDASSVTLTCRTNPGDRTMWFEFATSDLGQVISDNGTVSGGHPFAARYTMSNDHALGWFNLTISPTSLLDGGKYECFDGFTNTQSFAELIIIDQPINCTTTVPANNVIILGFSYSVECIVYFHASSNIAPSTSWAGPPPFNQGSANGTSTNGTRIITSGVSFVADKSMNAGRYVMTTYFDARYFGSLPPLSATNTPTFTVSNNGPIMFVEYAPFNGSYAPVKPSYEIGEDITCYVDARPVPTYGWVNMQTNQTVGSQTMRLTSAMVGTFTFRCRTFNSYGTLDIFTNITTNPITTPTVPTTLPPTTPIPAVSDCKDITGKWISTKIDGSQAALCMYVNLTSNGRIWGLLKNNTQNNAQIELVGATRNGIFDETGLVGIWSGNTGVSSFAVECHNCYGTESLIMTVVSRTETDDLGCGDGGQLRNSEQYTFSRTAYDVGFGFCFAP